MGFAVEGYLAPVVTADTAPGTLTPAEFRPTMSSYPQDWYEGAIGKLLGQVGGVDDVSIAEAVRRYHDRPARADEVTMARVGREREEAGRRLAKTRDVATWQREMAQLDAEEQAAHEPVAAGRLSSGEVVDYRRSLPSLWAAAGPDGRQALASALFARTDVMGFARLEYELTPDAIELGLDAALPAVFEFSGTIAEFGRGERGGIDDATGLVTGATFRLAEDAAGYFTMLTQTADRYGLPGAIYADRHGIFLREPGRPPTLAEQLTGKRSFTQVGRALDEAGIGWIGAHSAQAKGRVERLYADRFTGRRQSGERTLR